MSLNSKRNYRRTLVSVAAVFLAATTMTGCGASVPPAPTLTEADAARLTMGVEDAQPTKGVKVEPLATGGEPDVEPSAANQTPCVYLRLVEQHWAIQELRSDDPNVFGYYHYRDPISCQPSPIPWDEVDTEKLVQEMNKLQENDNPLQHCYELEWRERFPKGAEEPIDYYVDPTDLPIELLACLEAGILPELTRQ